MTQRTTCKTPETTEEKKQRDRNNARKYGRKEKTECMRKLQVTNISTEETKTIVMLKYNQRYEEGKDFSAQETSM